MPPSIEEYVDAKVTRSHEIFGPDVRILDEPGRALTANSTVTLYSVESVKRNVDTYVAVDGGMCDNLRPMLYGARYEAEVVGRFGGATRCHLVGKHCESGDVIVQRRQARATRGRATWSSRLPPAPTASRWRTTTTARRGRRSCSSATAPRGPWCGARPTPTCAGAADRR